jgi:microsomal epoxide hydrolase
LSGEIQPFEIRIPEEVLDDLRERLGRTRFVVPIAGSGWEYGANPEWLREITTYWRRDFDWRRQEAALNRIPQFITEIDGLRIHFLHQRSKEPDALALLVTHGWPGSVAEFTKIVAPLSDPVAYGGRREDAFHVICPSLPGYAFSQAPRAPGCDVKRVAELWIALMQRLGYARYGAQGGDWGAMVSSHVALLDGERCCGLHLNLVLAPRPRDEPATSLPPHERADLEAARRYLKEGAAYQAVQTLEPDTVGTALLDSPAGLAAWILDKFRRWSDCDGDPLRRFERDDLLTNVTLYWVTGTIVSSMRLYYESRLSGRFGPIDRRVEVPTAAAIFPHELFRPPRRWAERLYRIERWSEMVEGGHFAALEVPELLVDDVRAFFRAFR